MALGRCGPFKLLGRVDIQKFGRRFESNVGFFRNVDILDEWTPLSLRSAPVSATGLHPVGQRYDHC